MKKKSVFFLLLACLVIIFFCVPLQSTDECKAPPPEGPPPDNADDNHSFNLQGANVTALSRNLKEIPFIGILNNGNVEAMEKLLEKIGRNWIYMGKDFNPVELVKSVNLLIIPTGGLFGVQSSSSSKLKLLLEQYVNGGGKILCFAQQDLLDFQAIPVPIGESIHALGWRNTQSCYQGSIYFSQTGPIFSGQTSQRISAGVDGGFSSFPTGTGVLIRRTANQEPAMVAFPYGVNGGMVYLSATYPDWSLAHGACTLSELKLVRDLISYLKNPHLPIPMFDVSTNPTVQVQLNVKIKNTTEFTASKISLKTYTPFRDQVVFETEQSITLPPAGEIEVPISFTLTDAQINDLGVYGTYYELLDSEGNKVLNAVESDSGRFAIYSTPTPYVPKEQCQYWLTVDNEEVHMGDPVSFVLHARNYTDTEKQVEFQYQWNHQQIQPLTTLTLPPGEKVEYSFEKEANGVMFWVYSNGPSGANKIGKGFNLIRPKTRSYINLNHYWGIKAGLPISYKCEVNNSLDKDMDCQIKLSLLDFKENLLKVLYNDT
ncbi:MAG: hypothetical protein JSV88_08830, partial [Candidatus Aminicenantes bacterium]